MVMFVTRVGVISSKSPNRRAISLRISFSRMVFSSTPEPECTISDEGPPWESSMWTLAAGGGEEEEGEEALVCLMKMSPVLVGWSLPWNAFPGKQW